MRIRILRLKNMRIRIHNTAVTYVKFPLIQNLLCLVVREILTDKKTYYFIKKE